MAKPERKPFNIVRQRSDQIMRRIHSNLLGPTKPISFRTSVRYIITFTDDCSRHTAAYAMIAKSEVHIKLVMFINDMRRECNDDSVSISEIRTDGGSEYQTSAIAKENVKLLVCNPATPQRNRTAERINLEIEEKVRVNLLSVKMPA